MTTSDFLPTITRAEIDQVEASAPEVAKNRDIARRAALELLSQNRTDLVERFSDRGSIVAGLDMGQHFERTLSALAAERSWLEAAQARLLIVVDEALESVVDDDEEGADDA